VDGYLASIGENGKKKREGELISRRNSWARTLGAVTVLRTAAMLTQTNPHGGGLSSVQRALERIHVYTSVCMSCGFLNHRISSQRFRFVEAERVVFYNGKNLYPKSLLFAV
jgi:hypothetical protein